MVTEHAPDRSIGVGFELIFIGDMQKPRSASSFDISAHVSPEGTFDITTEGIFGEHLVVGRIMGDDCVGAVDNESPSTSDVSKVGGHDFPRLLEEPGSSSPAKASSTVMNVFRVVINMIPARLENCLPSKKI